MFEPDAAVTEGLARGICNASIGPRALQFDVRPGLPPWPPQPPPPPPPPPHAAAIPETANSATIATPGRRRAYRRRSGLWVSDALVCEFCPFFIEALAGTGVCMGAYKPFASVRVRITRTM